MRDVLLVVLGAVLGAVLTIAGKVLVDPILARRSRETERTERWLENVVEHAEGIEEHIQEMRNAVTSALGFDADAIAATIALSLTARWGPAPFRAAADHLNSADLKKSSNNIDEAWIAVGIARTDSEHGVISDEELYQPLYAVQWYETQVSNFEYEARKLLSGQS
jgi:hypothetical protein